MSKLPKIVVGVVCLFAFLLFALWFTRAHILDWELPNHEISTWVQKNDIKKVLAVLTHQDDELLMVGTLAGLVDAGVEVRLLTVTDGDGESRVLGQSVQDLIKERAAELNAVGQLLGVASVDQGYFSDLGFGEVAQADFDSLVLSKIEQYQPDTLLTWDTEKGLYGHKDHVRVARLLLDLCKRQEDDAQFSVNAVYSSTVSVWWRELLKKISPMYHQRYYAISNAESIEPEFSLSTRALAGERRAAFALYAKRGIVSGLNPFSGLPDFVGDAAFDREYFYKSF